MKTKIAISGDLGSGKSTIGRLIVERKGFKYHSGGMIYRGLAEKYNMTPAEFAKYSEEHPEIDKEIDGELVKISDCDENIVIDSRMAWHFVKNSFKVHLLADMKVAAERIINENRGKEQYSSLEDAIEKIKQRKDSENKRYMEKYNVDADKLNNYDLVIDTTDALPEEIYELIDSKLDLWLQNKTFDRVWSKKTGTWEATNE